MQDERSVPGAYKVKLARFDKFFAKLAPTLELFASDHNLLIEKYAHTLPEWAFFFRHPKGGVGQIELILTEANQSIRAVPSWNIGVWRKGTLHKWGEQTTLSLEPQQLRQCLEDILRAMVSWNKDELQMCDDPYWPKELTKGRLKAEDEKYPIPRLD